MRRKSFAQFCDTRAAEIIEKARLKNPTIDGMGYSFIGAATYTTAKRIYREYREFLKQERGK